MGFPQGNDRTNPKAYKKIDANQFTYNEGSLNYTLTGGAFHDNNGYGIPDGVQIIGSKPCFGAAGTVFDTSVENFHFKVPSGSPVVNAENYSLAELDGNPDNGYELVIPEHACKPGWSKLDNGWIYRRPSDNDSTNIGILKLFGENVVDSNGDGEPDGITVPVIRMVEIRNVDEFRLSSVSPGAVVTVNNNVTIIETDVDGKISVLADKPFKLNGKQIDVDGQQYLTLNIKGNEVASMKTETLGRKHKSDKFEFTGRPANDPMQKVKFTISGNSLKQEDLKVSVLRKVSGPGIRTGIDGLSGEVKLNGKSLDISGDGSYHFADGDYLIATKAAHSIDDLQKITVSNGGKGADLTIDKGDIVTSDAVSVVNGAVEFLDSDEGGVGNFIFELLETVFENVFEAIEDFVGEGDETISNA